MNISLQPHQETAKQWMINVEQRTKLSGAILADSMGLGKTVTLIALLVSDHEEKTESDPEEKSAPKITLIVTNKTLLLQLKHEIETKSSISNIIIYKTNKSLAKMNSKTKIILTTYGTVLADYSRFVSLAPKEKFSLFCTTFHRLVIDEAQIIRSIDSKTTNAIMKIQARKKWALTGTPFNNGVHDIVTLCKFIGAEYPYTNLSWWNNNINNKKAITKWRDKYFLSRGKEVLQLPELKHSFIKIELSKEEKECYQSVLEATMNLFHCLRRFFKGKEMVMHMLSSITRLRKLCNHPALTLGKAFTLSQSPKVDSEDFTSNYCIYCNRVDSEKLACGHFSCKTCITQFSQKYNPYCKESTLNEKIVCSCCYSILKNWVNIESNEWNNYDEDSRIYISIQKNSSKIIQLLTCIRQMEKEDATFRFILFSQWTSTLDMIGNVFQKENIQYSQLDGRIKSIHARSKIVNKFNTDKNIKVLLLSYQCGGIGLNLTSANCVILFDAWWNPFLEQQAIDRVHRIGQSRIVHVMHLYVPSSIEDKVLDIQRKKLEAGKKFINSQHSVNWFPNRQIDINKQKMEISEQDLYDMLSVKRYMTISEHAPLQNTIEPYKRIRSIHDIFEN